MIHWLWLIPAVMFGAAAGLFGHALCRAADDKESESVSMAMQRLGRFGSPFVDYEGCPRGATGRACMPIEEEVLLMEPLTDVDGGVWIPVNADALHELVKKYIELKEGRERKLSKNERVNLQKQVTKEVI